MHRHGHHVVVDLIAGAFVQIVADSGAVGQQVLDGYPIIDERWVGTEQLPRLRRQGKCAVGGE